MHELGIVTHVAKTLEDYAEENHIEKIGSVTLQVGEVSGIMTDYFEDCWNYFKGRHPLLKEAVLKIEVMPAVTLCEDCGKTYKTVQYGRICPFCGSEHTVLTTGNQCMIKEIEVEDDPADPETV